MNRDSGFLSMKNLEKKEAENNYLGSKEDVALKLLQIFEHINFFNLLQQEPEFKDLATKNTIEGLYWQLGSLKNEGQLQDTFARSQ